MSEEICSDFKERAALYRRLGREPSIVARTTFFAAAAAVTEVIGSDPTVFMTRLSATLEGANRARAAQILDGKLYAPGSLRANTADFIRFEQGLVEHALETLRGQCPRKYRTEIEAADWGLTRLSLWCSRFRSPAHARLHAALRITTRELRRAPRFARQGDRVAVGIALASL